MNINTNLSSLIAQSSLKISTHNLNQAIERMTTGCKINHAKDNAANYWISTSMSTKINAYQVAEDNAMMGLDLVQTASSSISAMSDLTSRLRALTTQARNGTYGDQSIEALNSEADSILKEISRLRSTTTYNGISLLEQNSKTKQTASTTSTTRAASQTTNGYIAPIIRRDTSSMTKLSDVSSTTAISGGTYSISTAAELAKLAEMTNNGLVAQGTEFVLANNIDLSGYSNWTPIGIYDENDYDSTKSFQGIFDGNGYEISNLQNHMNVDSSDSSQAAYFAAGLFGGVSNGTIKNLGVVNINISSNAYVAGGLAGVVIRSSVSNCYSTGKIYDEFPSCGAYNFWGGLLGGSIESSIENSYSETSVSNYTTLSYVGGFIGLESSQGSISNCYATGNIAGFYALGFAGLEEVDSIQNCYATGSVTATELEGNYGAACGFGMANDDAIANHCYSTGNVDGVVGAILEEFGAIPVLNGGKVTTSELNTLIDNGTLPSNRYQPSDGNSPIVPPDPDKPDNPDNPITPINPDDTNRPYQPGAITLQIGINSGLSSNITFGMGLDIWLFDSWTSIESDNAFDIVDNMLASFNAKQTELGAVENRLTSALEEISIQYENLVSSRSTIQDADIAEVSSEYIRQQILQQASATLMATANQAPAIALQLL